MVIFLLDDYVQLNQEKTLINPLTKTYPFLLSVESMFRLLANEQLLGGILQIEWKKRKYLVKVAPITHF